MKVLQNCNLTPQEYAVQSYLSVNCDMMEGSFNFLKPSLRSHIRITCRKKAYCVIDFVLIYNKRHLFQRLSVKFLLFQELGKVNKAFENDSEQRDTDNNFSLCNGVPTATPADETRNLVFIVLFINGDVTVNH